MGCIMFYSYPPADIVWDAGHAKCSRRLSTFVGLLPRRGESSRGVTSHSPCDWFGLPERLRGSCKDLLAISVGWPHLPSAKKPEPQGRWAASTCKAKKAIEAVQKYNLFLPVDSRTQGAVEK